MSTNPVGKGTTVEGMATPDITPAMVLAVIESVVAIAIAFGFDLSNQERDGLIALAGVLAAVLTLADAWIRNGRAGAVNALRDAADARMRERYQPKTAALPGGTGADVPRAD